MQNVRKKSFLSLALFSFVCMKAESIYSQNREDSFQPSMESLIASTLASDNGETRYLSLKSCLPLMVGAIAGLGAKKFLWEPANKLLKFAGGQNVLESQRAEKLRKIFDYGLGFGAMYLMSSFFMPEGVAWFAKIAVHFFWVL